MSSDKLFLALRLEGPFQAWGFESQYNRRQTGLMPTKSAIAGLCCAALGLNRGSSQEQVFLNQFREMSMTTLSIPRNPSGRDLQVRRLEDYHTVQNTRRATGKINADCVLTHRQYLNDASFGVVIEGPLELMTTIAEALRNPVWGLWLGRKNCVPSAPVFAGVKNTQDEALKLLIGDRSIECFTRQEEIEDFSKGQDSLLDNPVSFLSEKRVFSLRRIRMIQAKNNL